MSEEVQVCERCTGDGKITVQRRMTKWMAMDAGEGYEAGMKIPDTVKCPECDGAGYIVERLTPTDEAQS